jgi:hypothetical protein
MDTTDLKSADFFDKMIQQGVFTPEEVRSLVQMLSTNPRELPNRLHFDGYRSAEHAYSAPFTAWE